MGTTEPDPAAAPRSAAPIPALDVVVGTATAVGSALGLVARRVADVTSPVTSRVLGPALSPPMLSPRLHPSRFLDALARRGFTERIALQQDIEQVLDIVVPAVLAQVLAHVDLTTTVRDNVDIDELVAGVDLNAAARHIDLVTLVEQVIAAIDLPEIIRQSTGSVGSETIRGVRMQGVAADDAVARVVDRLIPHRHRKPPVIDLDAAPALPTPRSADAPAP